MEFEEAESTEDHKHNSNSARKSQYPCIVTAEAMGWRVERRGRNPPVSVRYLPHIDGN